MNENCLIIFLVLIICVLAIFVVPNEHFTNSGLSISNTYCDKLVSTYDKPENRKKVCGV